MSEDRYPIPVERYRGKQSLTVVCLNCGGEGQITPDDINQDGEWDCDCGGVITFKYAEADFKCPSCGKLHFERMPYPDGICSRVCALQAEYAKTLAERAA